MQCPQSSKSAAAHTEPFRNALIKADSRLQSLRLSHARTGSTQRERRERNTVADRTESREMNKKGGGKWDWGGQKFWDVCIWRSSDITAV